MKNYRTSEYVSAGHPDKIADAISDKLLDSYIKNDPYCKCGLETLIKDNIVVLAGEVSTSSKEIINVEEMVKNVIRDLGYSKEKHLDPDSIKIINLIGKQSVEINKAVVKDDGEIGASDQGVMFGFATNQTPNFMPLDIFIAKVVLNDVLNDKAFIRQDGVSLVGPDAKSQVTLIEENGIKYIDTILISTMHSESLPLEILRASIKLSILDSINKNNLSKYLNNETKFQINPANSWHIGGSVSDCGLTGRKIVVDAYGGGTDYQCVGGGAFSGKDGHTKVDRSAAYLCRYLSINILNAGDFDEVQTQISYMIGIAEPASLRITTKKNGIEKVFDEDLINKIKSIFPITPKQISNHFSLYRPIYYQTAKYGHFGISSYPWEQLDKVEELKKLFNL